MLGKITQKHGDITGLQNSNPELAKKITNRAQSRVKETKIAIKDARSQGNSKLVDELKEKLSKAKERVSLIKEKINSLIENKTTSNSTPVVDNPEVLETPINREDIVSTDNHYNGAGLIDQINETVEKDSFFYKEIGNAIENSKKDYFEALASGDESKIAETKDKYQSYQIAKQSMAEFMSNKFQMYRELISKLSVR